MTARQLYTLAPMVLGDERDAYLMGLYTQGRAKLLPAKRMMLLYLGARRRARAEELLRATSTGKRVRIYDKT